MSPTRDLKTIKKPLSPPSLEELAKVLAPALAATYTHSEIHVVPCPDLREPPYHLAAAGLSGDERVADVGGQAHLMPQPQRDKTYSLLDLAQRMELPATGGHILGASAGPFHVIGQNCELAPNLSWTDSFASVVNRTYVTQFHPSSSPPTTACTLSPSLDAALLANLYGSAGQPGPVLRIRARERRRLNDGDSSSSSAEHKASFSEILRRALATHYGDDRQISLGGVFAVRRGTAHYHVMPDFPTTPWESRKEFDAWLTWHDFGAPMACLSVFHSADPAGLGLRVEHTHAFSGVGNVEGGKGGGHYHYDVLPEERGGKTEEIEYEGYFNVAKWVYRIDRPEMQA